MTSTQNDIVSLPSAPGDAAMHDHHAVEELDAVPTLLEREPAVVVGLVAAVVVLLATALGEGRRGLLRGLLAAAIAGGSAAVIRQRVTPWLDDGDDADMAGAA